MAAPKCGVQAPVAIDLQCATTAAVAMTMVMMTMTAHASAEVTMVLRASVGRRLTWTALTGK